MMIAAQVAREREVVLSLTGQALVFARNFCPGLIETLFGLGICDDLLAELARIIRRTAASVRAIPTEALRPFKAMVAPGLHSRVPCSN